MDYRDAYELSLEPALWEGLDLWLTEWEYL